MLVRRLARPLIGAAFVNSGIQGLREADERAVRARKLGLRDADLALRVSAGVQVGAGALITLGRLPRLSALALAATVLPEAMTAHTFWTSDDRQLRTAERELFVKDLGLLGGLLIAAADTQGRPSLPRRARIEARRARSEARLATVKARSEARVATEKARRRLAEVT